MMMKHIKHISDDAIVFLLQIKKIHILFIRFKMMRCKLIFNLEALIEFLNVLKDVNIIVLYITNETSP